MLVAAIVRLTLRGGQGRPVVPAAGCPAGYCGAAVAGGGIGVVVIGAVGAATATGAATVICGTLAHRLDRLGICSPSWIGAAFWMLFDRSGNS